jgi:amidohydrolase
MRTLLCVPLVLALITPNSQAQQKSSSPDNRSIDALIDREIGPLVETYKMLHAAPELSHHEDKTSTFFASELRKLGFTVTERVGKYERPDWQGFGVVGVLRNGSGPTILLRTELDALPVDEQTKLPYASKVKVKDEARGEVSVMHACGHDLHIANMLGTARLLAESKDRWKGTLIVLGQPAEETIDGARAVLRDGLYTRFPKPDYVLALHDNAELEAGRVGYTPGYALSSSTSIDIKVRGIGGHSSKPETTKDPIVLASQIVVALQTIVSREISPLDSAVVTVGSIHGGTRYNIIPEEVDLQLTVRTYKEDVRQHILASIERIAKGTASAAGVPERLAPIVKVNETEVVAATYNEPGLTERMAAVFRQALGNDNVVKMDPVMVSEDFGYYSSGQQIPTLTFILGAVDPLKARESKTSGTSLPSLHSPLFAPAADVALRTGIKAMTSAVLDLMKQ